MFATLIGIVALPVALVPQSTPQDTLGHCYAFQSEGMQLCAEVVATGVTVPFGLDFLPDGRFLVGDRPAGVLTLVDPTRRERQAVGGLPRVAGTSGGGLLDIMVHPDYARNGWIYIAYGTAVPGGLTTAVDRFKLRDGQLVERQRLFEARPGVNVDNHLGCRLVIKDGFLFISLGERDTRGFAQDLTVHHGKIIRIHEDGRIPKDNPFVSTPFAMPEIWAYGVRNPQGMALHPQTRELWENEHGPRGGDEVNIIRRGANYGWPVITYGREYSGPPVGDSLTHKEGMEQPVHYWVPSIAPSGMAFYTGRLMPKWRGSIFTGALALTHLNRIVVERGKVVKEERMFTEKRWRVRSVRQAPDGSLYFGVDGGMVLRIRPA